MSSSITTTASNYFDEKRIPAIIESLVSGLAFHRPADPIDYLQNCLNQLKGKDLNQVHWDAFLGSVERKEPKPLSYYQYTVPFTSLANGEKFQEKKTLANEKQNQIIEKVQKSQEVRSEPKLVFVLGGPGSGKGTQCEKLIKEFGVQHISVGDLLREEVKSGSEIGQQMDALMKEGKIVPLEIVLQVLKKALNQLQAGEGKTILIDGFPREMQQAIEFEKSIMKAEFVLFFECSEAVMEQRLLQRGLTSGRVDDNIESIKKRFKTFIEQSLPVTEYFEQQNSLVKINSEQSPEEVYAQVRQHFL